MNNMFFSLFIPSSLFNILILPFTRINYVFPHKVEHLFVALHYLDLSYGFYACTTFERRMKLVNVAFSDVNDVHYESNHLSEQRGLLTLDLKYM